jgi:hypothetical protein
MRNSSALAAARFRRVRCLSIGFDHSLDSTPKLCVGSRPAPIC